MPKVSLVFIEMQDFCTYGYMVGNFMVTYEWSYNEVISDRISNDMPTTMKFLNMVIPILMHLCSCLPLKLA